MSAFLLGRYNWDLNIDKDGHRDYKITWVVQTTSVDDGPGVVLTAAGIPLVGSFWAYGNDANPYALCWPTASIKLRDPQELYWTVDQTFSTKPFRRCQDSQVENPLAEPMRLSGSFRKFQEEAQVDRNGKVMKSSSHELYKGKVVEFDANRPNVKCGYNMLVLPLGLIAQFIDVVNDATMWGLPPRCIKLSDAEWKRMVYGSCNYYYGVDFDLEVKYDTWDRKVPDEGRMVLLGWNPGDPIEDRLDPDDEDATTSEANHLNPKNYYVYKDKNGENTRAFLDGKGRPVDKEEDILIHTFEKYREGNLLALGVPASL